MWLAVGRAGQGKGARELTISRATLKQWRIGVGGKQAQSLGPQWRALFCSISEDLRLPPLWEPTHYPIIPLSHDTPVLLLSHPPLPHWASQYPSPCHMV